MNRLASWLCVGALLCSSCTSAPNEGEVLEANSSFYKALNVMFTGDAEPMRQVWSHADDITYMGPMGELETGWPAISKMWAEQAALKLGGAVEPENVHVVAGRDLAVVVDVEKGSNVAADGSPLSVSIRATNTYRLESGAWKMIGHHTDLLPYLTDDR